MPRFKYHDFSVFWPDQDKTIQLEWNLNDSEGIAYDTPEDISDMVPTLACIGHAQADTIDPSTLTSAIGEMTYPDNTTFRHKGKKLELDTAHSYVESGFIHCIQIALDSIEEEISGEN